MLLITEMKYPTQGNLIEIYLAFDLDAENSKSIVLASDKSLLVASHVRG